MKDSENEKTESPSRQRPSRFYLGDLVGSLPIIAIGIIIVLVLFILSLSEPEPERYCFGDPEGSIDAKATGPTSATVYFCGFSSEPSPMNLKIVLQKGTSYGNYTFPSNESGAILVLEWGTDMGNITYLDLDNDEEVDLGDRLLVTGLVPDSIYTVDLIWAPSGDRLDSQMFSLQTG